MNTLLTRLISLGKIAPAAVVFMCAVGTPAAHSHEYEALIKSKKYVEAEQAVTNKLAIDANNADALVAKAELLLIEGKDTSLDEGVKVAERCIAHNPKNSQCHESLANVLGAKGMRGGFMSALSYIGKIRDSLKTAIELDPRNVTARNTLMGFYLVAPSMVGGGTSRAKELIADTSKINHELSNLLQAMLDLKEDNIDRASAGALSVTSDPASPVGLQQKNVLSSIGYAYMGQKKYGEAEKLFREMTKRFPEASTGHLGLGRSLLEQNKPQDAAVHLEKSVNLEASADALYYLGKTRLLLGEKAKAASAFERALGAKPELPKKARQDAEEQLAALK